MFLISAGSRSRGELTALSLVLDSVSYVAETMLHLTLDPDELGREFLEQLRDAMPCRLVPRSQTVW